MAAVVGARGAVVNLCFLLSDVFLAFAWFIDPFETTFGSFALATSVSTMVAPSFPVTVFALTTQLEILKASMFRFEFWFNAAKTVRWLAAYCVCFRGTLWTKVWTVILALLCFDGFLRRDALPSDPTLDPSSRTWRAISAFFHYH